MPDPDQPPKHEDSPAELPDYEVGSAGRNWWPWILGAVSVALVAGAIWQGPSLYREAKARRALALIAQGEAAMKTGDYAEATSLFRRGFLMAPGDSRVLEKVDFQSAVFGNAEALERLRRKVLDKTASPDEAIVVAEYAARARDAALAGLALDALPPSVDASLAGRRSVVRIQILVIGGKLDAAAQAASEASAALPGVEGDKARLLLAELLLLGKPPAEADADKILRALAARPTVDGAGALRLLARYRIFHPAAGVLSADEIARQLRKHPKKSIEDELLLADLDLAARPAGRAAILAAFAEKQKSLPDLKERVAIGRWLISKSAFPEAAVVVTEGDAVSDSSALFVRMDALSGQRLWEESRQLLNKAQNSNLSEEQRHVFLARIAEELGDAVQAESEWSTVMAGLRLSDSSTILFVARYAEARHRTPEAVAAYRLLVEDPATKADGLLGLTRTLPPSTSTEESLSVYQRLLAISPDSVEARCGEAYLQLLLNRDIEKSRATAGELLIAHPDVLAFQSVKALAELRNNNPAAALAAYGSSVDWTTASDAWKAIRVAVLEANGQSSAAQALLAQIQKANLRAEEQNLLPPKQP